MLRELSKFENLGTVAILAEILRQISDGGIWTVISIEEYLSRRIVDDRNVFDGCVHFGAAIGAIQITDKGHLRVPAGVQRWLSIPNATSSNLRYLLCVAIAADESFASVFSPEYLGFDSLRGRAIVRNTAFGFHLASWRRVLLDFGVLEPHEDYAIRSYWLCAELEQLLERRAVEARNHRLLSRDQLYKKLDAQRDAGEVAERFVVEFERRRIAAHPNLHAIRAISAIDVAAGFDVVSFETIQSRQVDRFIEVKSYSGQLQFYWSRNEREVAKQKRSQYYLYLVDRTKIESADYIPLIVENPVDFFANATDWVSQPEIVLMTRL